MSTPCPDCGGSGYQPDRKTECLRCDGYGRLRLSQRETTPAFLNRPWSAFERDRNYDWGSQFLDKVLLVLIGTIIGVIIGKLI